MKICRFLKRKKKGQKICRRCAFWMCLCMYKLLYELLKLRFVYVPILVYYCWCSMCKSDTYAMTVVFNNKLRSRGFILFITTCMRVDTSQHHIGRIIISLNSISLHSSLNTRNLLFFCAIVSNVAK